MQGGSAGDLTPKIGEAVSLEGVLVRRDTVHGRNWLIHQPKVDQQLAAMVLEVVEHDRAQQSHARQGHLRFAIYFEGPLLPHVFVAPAAKSGLPE